MLLLWLEPDYVVGIAVWCGLLWGLLVALLRWRRAERTHTAPVPWRLRCVSAGLSVWVLLVTVTLLELVFALFVDHSEAFNGSNVSKRWFRRHIDAERNADGFRDGRLVNSPLPKGMRRLVVLGDSFTAGHGITRMEDRFTERLEALLNRESPRWQVLNLGEPGYDVSLAEAMEAGYLDRGGPVQMILYAYMINDIEGYDPRTEQVIQAIAARRRAPHWIIERTYFINWVYHRWVQYSAGSAMDYFPHLVEAYDGPAWNGVSMKLRAMSDRAADQGVEFRVAVLPFLHNLGPAYPFARAHQKLLAWGQTHQVPMLDLEPLLARHAAEGLMVNRFDNHPNERAHELMAGALADWIEESVPGSR